MGPITLFDKSFLQSLSADEAIWFDNFFLANVCPLFYVETLADLEKSVRQGRTPEQEVGIIAEKFPELSGTPNAYHVPVCISNLLGGPVPMEGQQILIPEARLTKSGEKTAIVVELSEEAKAFQRWQSGDFLDVERETASKWRSQIQALDLKLLTKRLIDLGVGTTRCATIEEAFRISVEFVSDLEKMPQKLGLMSVVLNIPTDVISKIVNRWFVSGKPSFEEFAPYAAHILKVEIFFYLCLASGLIAPERASNRVDINYLYYLPFCMVFVSSDKLHQRCAPLFLRGNQQFVWGEDLKKSLREIDNYYKGLPKEATDKGIYSFAAYPPEIENSVVIKMWDIFCNWRHREEIKESDINSKVLMDEIRKMADAPSAEVQGMDPDLADSMVVKRSIRRQRGSWYQLPKDFKPKNEDIA